MKHFRIFKKYLFFLSISDNSNNYSNYSNKDLKSLFIHLLKSEFYIKKSIVFFFNFANLLSYGFFFKNISKISNKHSFIIFKILDFFISFYTKKLKELVYVVTNVNKKELNEVIEFKNSKNINSTEDNIFDAIVVGSGPAGSISSYFLKKKFKKVLILEKGKYLSLCKKKHPGKEFIYKWKNGGINTTVINDQISFASGECLGGGSEINSGLLHFPDKQMINEWVNDYKIKGLDYENLKSLLEKIIKLVPISRLTEEKQNNLGKIFLNGIKKEKLKYETLHKFQYQEENKDIKSSMTNTLIDMFLKEGGKIETNFEVKKFYKSENLWNVEGIKNKKIINYKSKYVFLCAGSIYSNILLANNNLVKKSKINEFKFHPMLKIIVQYDDEVQKGDENVHNIQVTNYLPDYLIGQAASGYQFLKMAAYDSKNLQLNIENNWKKMSIYHVTFSMGKGKIYFSNFLKKPILGYKINNSELGLIKESIRNTSKLLFRTGAKSIYIVGKKIIKLDKYNLEDKLKNIKKISEIKFSAVHILGGVKSGEANNHSVDSYGKLNNYENFYVNDSSLIYNKLLKNPQGTIMSISKRNIDNFLSKIS